ncbi:MAG: NAD-dependent dehydratase [Spirochaetae bacterium HGW-Spirochaetae-7]|jgi:nucleoside-diphosphate-sugar epimerase|nr:MAG: NAD-dependent dehydratase [Spirochaetae bacterium HGW-Spirochaetae-7]
MRVLFLGGTGNISSECANEALEQGIELHVLSRGTRPSPRGATAILADVADMAAVARAIGGMRFDAVVDFLCYEPESARRAVAIFSGLTGQYVFISTASAYEKPPRRHVIDEDTPLANPYWQYARDKIACERVFMEARNRSGFPVTIVRPSHTYGQTWIPTAFVSSDFTVAARMIAGREVVVPGDGQSLWTLTHARDFAVGLVGLLGRSESIGEAYTIAGDEVLTWDEIHDAVATALGISAGDGPRLVHVPSEFIARVDPPMGERLLGDKAWSSVFDCAKVKRLVPEFRTTIPLSRGLAESVAWRRADPARMAADGIMDERIDRILGAWKKAMEQAG